MTRARASRSSSAFASAGIGSEKLMNLILPARRGTWHALPGAQHLDAVPGQVEGWLATRHRFSQSGADSAASASTSAARSAPIICHVSTGLSLQVGYSRAQAGAG